MLRNLLLANPAADEKLYVEDVFSTWLYTGNSSTQTIANGIDLSGQGGLVWIKARNSVLSHDLYDTARGATKSLYSNGTVAQETFANSLTSFNSNGFSLGNDANTSVNTTGTTYASWTFRKAPKFFDVVTYTGNGVAGRQIAHSLGATPGFMLIKCTSTTGSWIAWHRAYNNGNGYAQLNQTYAFGPDNGFAFGSGIGTGYVAPTSTNFTISDWSQVNTNGATYVAYLFAHDTTSDGIIQCGSFTNDASGNATVNLGWEPQWLLVKATSSLSGWILYDSMRGLTVAGTGDARLEANLTNAEVLSTDCYALPDGFGFQNFGANNTFAYIAIRRGPMRTPTSGTSVFQPVTYTSTNVDSRLVTTGIVTDMVMARTRDTSAGAFYVADRLRGNASLGTVLTDAENNDVDSFMPPYAGSYGNAFSAMNGFGVGNDITRKLNSGTLTQIAHAFRRAPSFFDTVCYTGNGVSGRLITHNLGVIPELIIVKNRSAATGWEVGTLFNSSDYTRLSLHTSSAAEISAYADIFQPQPTATTFKVTAQTLVNFNAYNYVAYLFASCPGVSKVGSYTGNGSSQTINCGFAAGARFVMIKRTDSTGNWHVWDTARGIIAANDPILYLNGNDAELTTNDSVDPDNSGFIVNQNATTSINVSGATYIYLAIA